MQGYTRVRVIAVAILGLIATSLRMYNSVDGTKGRVIGMED